VTQPGGDIQDLLRQLGVEALLREVESAGLKLHGRRMQCPWSQHSEPEARPAVVTELDSHVPGIYCHVCKDSGDLVDLLQQTRSISREAALAHVSTLKPPQRAPQLRVVSRPPEEEEGKLSPAEVSQLWGLLADDSPEGREYLRGLALEPVVDDALVRFAGTDDSTPREVVSHARRGYRLALQLSDVFGNPRGIQLLRITSAPRSETEVVSVKGSSTVRAFFGETAAVRFAPVVVVAQGARDWLAASLWAAGSGAAIIGAVGHSSLRRLATELQAAGVEVRGKVFALLEHNDKPKEESHREFTALKMLLSERGALCVEVKTPDEYATVSDWWKASPDRKWPPPAVAAEFEGLPGSDEEPKTVLAPGSALPTQKLHTTEKYAQNFSTLMALLDDPVSRSVALGTREEVSFSLMTHEIFVGGRAVNDDDFSTVRLNLEKYSRSTDGKPLQFQKPDIIAALRLLARRNSLHPLREYVSSLAWDGKHRLEVDFPRVLGHEAGGFDARILRRWAVSAVARAMQPGCKVDTVLILKGDGGVGKTKFFEALGGAWYSGSDVVPGDKDGKLVMRKFWMIEWGELDEMKRSRSMHATRRFLSLRRDDFREPYGRDIVSSDRHCVIVGTTNEQAIFQQMEGGHRRFWPIEVLAGAIDLRWLKANRDQLFAEALAIYREGLTCPDCADDADEHCAKHRWFLTPDEEAQLRARHENFEEDPHPWFDVLADWIESTNPTSLTTAQILQQGVDQKVEHFKPPNNNQIADLMKRLGWKKSREKGTRGRRFWVREEGLL